MCSCVVFENSLQKSRGCVWPKEATAINKIRRRERGPSRDNRACQKQHGIVAVKGRSARPSGGKTRGAKRDRAEWPTRQAVRGRCRETSVVEMHLSMEVASERTGVRSSRSSPRSGLGAIPGVGFGGEILEAGNARVVRQARHRVDWEGREAESHPPEPPRRRETAGCSIVRPTGGNSSRAGGMGGTDKIPFVRGATSPRANEARVLEIEAAMAETGRTHHACGPRNGASRCVKPVR